MQFVKDKEWLIENLDQEDLRIVDCRYDLSDSNLGKTLYKKSHIPGASYFDLKEQLSSPVKKHGGRHPLPDLEEFKMALEKAGIDRSKKVIAYDDGGSMYASRLWCLLKYLGHEIVYILEEGFSGWQSSNYPLTEDIPSFERADYEIDLQEEMLASVEQVREIVESKENSPVLIDSRARKRYLGEVEPIDQIAGHIPGAINKVWDEGLDKGSFKSKDEQQKRFSELDLEEPIVVYCGSGVSATPNYIALKMAGFQNVKLYAGSYSDWISYEENDIETGIETKKD